MTGPGERLRVTVLNPFGYELFEPASRASRAFGGAEVQLRYLAAGLAALPGTDVTVLVEQPVSGPRHDRIDGVRIRFVPPSGPVERLRARLPVPSGYAVAAVRSRPDVVVQRGGAVLAVDAALAAGLVRAAFVFMSAHDWDCGMRHVRPGQRLSGRAYVAALRRAHGVVAQSRWQAAELQRWHGIEAAVLENVLPPVPVTGPVAGGPVLWIGRCVGWKRPDAFLDLAAALPHRRFVMVSPAYPGEEELAGQVAARARAAANVEFVPSLPFREADALFAGASVFANTSVAEGFPNTFLQAWRVGVPVASLDVDPDGVVRRHGLGVVGDGSLERLARRLDALLGDPAVLRAAGRAARAHFDSRHDAGTAVLRLRAVLADAVHRARGSRWDRIRTPVPR
jgi:glycosyltransferase involved in cell wall biosynthesis